MSPRSQPVYQKESQCTTKRAKADYLLQGRKAVLSQCIQDRTVTCWDNHRRLMSAPCNLLLSKLKCNCEESALFVGHHLQKDSSEIFILSSFEAEKTCSALPGYVSWSQTLVFITWVMTTWGRSHFSYKEHSHTPCSVLFNLGDWKETQRTWNLLLGICSCTSNH